MSIYHSSHHSIEDTSYLNCVWSTSNRDEYDDFDFTLNVETWHSHIEPYIVSILENQFPTLKKEIILSHIHEFLTLNYSTISGKPYNLSRRGVLYKKPIIIEQCNKLIQNLI
jgi:hypothetical protein